MAVHVTKTYLSENNRGILQIALELARDKFNQNAETLRKEDNPALSIAYGGLANTFVDQAAAAAELLSQITQADEIIVQEYKEV